jgi:hypothetical protein
MDLDIGYLSRRANTLQQRLPDAPQVIHLCDEDNTTVSDSQDQEPSNETQNPNYPDYNTLQQHVVRTEMTFSSHGLPKLPDFTLDDEDPELLKSLQPRGVPATHTYFLSKDHKEADDDISADEDMSDTEELGASALADLDFLASADARLRDLSETQLHISASHARADLASLPPTAPHAPLRQGRAAGLLGKGVTAVASSLRGAGVQLADDEPEADLVVERRDSAQRQKPSHHRSRPRPRGPPALPSGPSPDPHALTRV